MIGTGRKPFLSSSHSEASSAPSSGSVNTLRSCASAPPASSNSRSSLAAAAATSAAASAAHSAPAVVTGARLSGLLRALRAGVARLVLPVERLARFAGRTLFRAVHIRPALAPAAVLLPVAAVLAPVHVAVAPGVDIVAARALGEGGLPDLRRLDVAPARAADRRALAARSEEH